jgi:hypothetical protein
MWEPYPVLDVSSWEAVADEPAGQEEKLWLRDEAEDRWLYKPIVQKEGHSQGEDWAEKITSHLATILTAPCAKVELAIRNQVRGIISKNLRPEAYDMHSGQVLLSSAIDGYMAGADNIKGRPGHSLSNIRAVLDSAMPPPGADLPEGFSAFDTFVGYLVLDAWVANRDRHDENWSVLIPRPPLSPEQPMRLCGAYDQAGSLGYNLRDSERETP